jgi:hypothetical protein
MSPASVAKTLSLGSMGSDASGRGSGRSAGRENRVDTRTLYPKRPACGSPG